MSPLRFATSMMRPIASAWAATVSSNFAGSPLTRMVMITDMDHSLLVGLRDPTDPIPGAAADALATDEQRARFQALAGCRNARNGALSWLTPRRLLWTNPDSGTTIVGLRAAAAAMRELRKLRAASPEVSALRPLGSQSR